MTPAKNLQEREERIAVAAFYPGWPGGTPGTGVGLLRSEWQAETGGHLRHYLHLGP